MKHKTDIEIGQRAAEECGRIFPTRKEAARELRRERKAIWTWEVGGTPSADVLARLHYAGADVIYILTGRRTK